MLEIGPGMGFFTIPMARMVGEHGRIVCVDLQEKMLNSLQRRARTAGLADRINTRLATSDTLNVRDYTSRIDFALAFAVVHEVPDQDKLFKEVHETMKSGALLLVSEPTGHVTTHAFTETIAAADRIGFGLIDRPTIKRSFSAVFTRR